MRHPTIVLPLLVSLSFLITVDRGLGQEEPPLTATPVVQASLRNSGPLPPGCTLEKTVQSLLAFFDAFNRGATEELARTFPTEAVYPYSDKRGFQWYSVTDENGHFVTYDPANLPAYFAMRHQQHERLQLLELEVAASRNTHVSLVYRLSRQADDLPHHEMVGKGAMYCDDQTIFVWSMAQDMPAKALRSCKVCDDARAYGAGLERVQMGSVRAAKGIGTSDHLLETSSVLVGQ